MASITKRRGKWRVQVRRCGHEMSKTFAVHADAEKWARDCERLIDMDLDPRARRFSAKDRFGALIDTHVDDLHAYGKPLRRSKRAVLERLNAELGDEPVGALTRERLIRYGLARSQAGAGPATLAIDFSFIGTVMTHAAAMHGLQVNLEGLKLARIALARMGAIGAPRERDRRPTSKELDTLLARFASNQRDTMPMARIVKFAIATGMRLDEIVRIEWKDLDPNTRTILVRNRKDPRRKDDNNQRVPLLGATGFDGMRLLEEQREATCSSIADHPLREQERLGHRQNEVAELVRLAGEAECPDGLVDQPVPDPHVRIDAAEPGHGSPSAFRRRSNTEPSGTGLLPKPLTETQADGGIRPVWPRDLDSGVRRWIVPPLS